MRIARRHVFDQYQTSWNTKSLADYANFLLARHVVTQFKRGAIEVQSFLTTLVVLKTLPNTLNKSDVMRPEKSQLITTVMIYKAAQRSPM